MQALTTYAHSLFTRFTHWLVAGHGGPLVLASTIALAGIGAAAANQPTSSANTRHSVGNTVAPQVPAEHHCHDAGEDGP
ncbi:MAG: hypothetical protein JWO42_2818 [Chloroflexi bacterium]|jgi:hypothetical protein|nr:hypothetical protein [Chloroflexota bacterium]